MSNKKEAISKLRQLIIDQELSDFHGCGGVGSMCERLVEIRDLLLQEEEKPKEILRKSYPYCSNEICGLRQQQTENKCHRCGSEYIWPDNQNKSIDHYVIQGNADGSSKLYKNGHIIEESDENKGEG